MGGVFDERFNSVHEVPSQEDELAPEMARDVVSLLRLGRLEDSFNLYGHSFVMRTLNIEEEIAVDDLLVQKFASNYNDKATKVAYVAASLTMVDDERLVTSLGMGETNDLSRCFDRVKKWFKPVIEKLFEHYLALEVRQAEALAELEKKDKPSLSSSVALSDSSTDKVSSPES